GGVINAYTAHDRTVFHIDMPSRHWRTAVAILSEAVQHAAFPEEEWRREKDVILREIAMNRDKPDRVVGQLLWETAFTVHPYRYPVIGYRDLFASLTRNDLVAYYRRHFAPNFMIAVMVGDMSAPEAETAMREALGSFPRHAGALAAIPEEPSQIAPRQVRQAGPYELARLEWAYHTVPLQHPDAPDLDVLAILAGSGRTSRLGQTIKETRRLAHEISAWSFTPKEPGLFGISAVFDPAKEAALAPAIEKEVDTWKTKLFKAGEVEKARNMLLLSTLTEQETMHGQAASLASGEYYAGNPRFSELYLAGLKRVTPETLRNIAKKYLVPSNRTLAILCPTGATEQAVAPSALSTNVPGVHKQVLPNGLTLLTREDHRLPLVAFCAASAGGVLDEDARNNGIAHLTAEMLLSGTGSRSADTIAGLLEFRGASLSPFSGYSSFGLQGQCLSRDAAVMLDLVADCLRQSIFPTNELDKKKAEQIAGILRQQESPFFQADNVLRKTLFPDHPYRFFPIGTIASVRSLQRDDLLRYHRRALTASNTVLAVFGDISPSQVSEACARVFRTLPSGTRSRPVLPPPNPSLPLRTCPANGRIVTPVPREQTIVLVGMPGIAVLDPRKDAIAILLEALNGLSSDLLIRIRDQEGLAYYAGALQLTGPAPGMLTLYAGTRTDAVERVTALIQEEMERLTTEGLREEEWVRAREQLTAAFDRKCQANGELAMDCVINELLGLGYAHGFSIRTRLERLPPSDALEAARSLFEPDRCVISIAVPETDANRNIPDRKESRHASGKPDEGKPE
ncbi:MAG: insulinase family protein, partial [Lentisphaerae bacterium]|nr:insulinase family protein [Lentisphaerota bacterium]